MKISLSTAVLILLYTSCYGAINDTAFYLSEQENETVALRDTVPQPRKVMMRSLIIPGWGQITNQQAWKVPIVYAVIGGVVYSTFYFDEQYQGYRAAYYNSFPQHTDERFGPTPDFVDPELTTQGIRNRRNELRNNRDLAIVVSVLAHVLNAVDAYVFAQFRDFDVSDDLSARIDPGIHILPSGEYISGITLNIRF